MDLNFCIARGKFEVGCMSLKTRKLLRLAGFIGCMLCGAKPVRTVYWEFRIRCCRTCLLKHKLPGFYLTEYFGLPPCDLWKRKYRAASLGRLRVNTYWKAHMLPLLRFYHGTESFEAYIQQKGLGRQVFGWQNQDQQAYREKELQKIEKWQENCLLCCHLWAPPITDFEIECMAMACPESVIDKLLLSLIPQALRHVL